MAKKKEADPVCNVHEALVPLLVPIDDLAPDPENARLHDEKNIKAIMDSLEQFGQDQPLVVQQNGMIVRKGNGRRLAAKELGWTYIAAIVCDENDTAAIARAIADNRTGELAEWDFQKLGELFTQLQEDDFDIHRLGWNDYEIQPMLQAEWSPPAVEALPDELGGDHTRMETIRVTAEQLEVINRAIKTNREKESNDAISEGRCLELICADWMS